MPIPLLLPLASLQVWLTPVWILSLGVTAGVVMLALLYGLWWLVSRRTAQAVSWTAGDGVLMPIVYTLGGWVLLTVLAAPTMPLAETWDSIRRLGTVGTQTYQVQVPAGTEDQVVAVDFRANELQSYRFATDQDLRISVTEGVAYTSPDLVVLGDEPYEWDPTKKQARGFRGHVAQLFVTNQSDLPAQLEVSFQTDVEMAEIHHLPITMAAIWGGMLLYFLIAWLMPGIATVATGSAKEAISQPLFMVLTIVGGIALVAYIYIPYNTFGEDVKLLTDSGLTTIMVLGIVFALWTASTSVSEEIEGKTALTMLSKPVSRAQFVLGKFLGILWPLLTMFVILGTVLLLVISYKVIYDARESAHPVPNWQLCYEAMIIAVPGLVLAYLEAATLAAVSVAISTRLPMLPNLIICGSLYVIGNLVPQLVLSSVGQLPYVEFTGKLFAVVLPVLDHFNIQPAIAAGQEVPYAYLGMALVYCVLYCTAAMLLALILFEDRDLA